MVCGTIHGLAAQSWDCSAQSIDQDNLGLLVRKASVDLEYERWVTRAAEANHIWGGGGGGGGGEGGLK